ncbi:hypothetical protein K437DRAFT_265638 [Tilletiaria anomala UBC 951]|uniref:Uncharacterized protein n=1 Tax=Tilletiaria anomala (strain ATCC 24038 / CBS 436.72 / UBC 951) TaxID=1037660 RepID=A0A066WHT2_TILAU|nr:uncharacterized protein K437DRAFT_265638 [Tilletiaria anomala UBC 951]KDN53577.1 hypothetical protein K437DRAFT_265638 [Tilletiaria anomala UBC 951]
MRFTVTAATFALLAAYAAAQSGLTINTPSSLIVCVPSLIQWNGGQGPYFLTVNQGGSQSVILETLVNGQNQTSYTWNVNLSAGTSVTLAIRDSTGATNFAQAVTIQAGSSTSCMSSSASSSSSHSSTSSSAPATTSSTTASSSTTISSTTSSTSSTSSTPSATSSAPSVTNAATANVANAVGALAVAAVAVALI